MTNDLKVLNLYAGIGGNRKLWDEVTDVDVTAVEIEEEIAEVYQDNFPQDEIVVSDAHEYLKENYENYDFIWSSPPCPSHSRIRKYVGVEAKGQNEPIYPNMELYEEILFLKGYFKGKYCVENVQSWYKPLVKPKKRQRHYFWSNFFIPKIELRGDGINSKKGENTIKNLQERHGFDLSNYNGNIDKTKILRNCVHPKLGKHILESAYSKKVEKLEAFCFEESEEDE